MNSLVIVQSSVSNLTSTGEILRGDEEKNNFSDDSFFEEWNVTFGGSNIDIGHSVQQTTDNGFITVGYTRSYGESSGRNIWLIKTDTFGNEEWNVTFGGDDDDVGESVQQTTDGGFIITGYTESYGSGLKDVILLKTDDSGNEEWNVTFGGTYDEEGYAVIQTTDGGFLVAGVTTSFSSGGRDVWLIKTDNLGNEEWRSSLGGLSSDGGRSVQQTTDGGYIITGWTFSFGPGYMGNTWLVKTDGLGNEIWNSTFGGSDADRGYSVKQTTDGGFVITGYTSSFGAGLDDMILIKTNGNGDETWNVTFGGGGRDYGHAVQQRKDGGYIIAGYTLSYGSGGDDVWVIKTDEFGNELYSDTYGGSSSDIAYEIQKTNDGGYIVTGHTLSYGAGVHDVWLIKIGEDLPEIRNISVYPNPQFANNSVNISCTIVDTINVDQSRLIISDPFNVTHNVSLHNSENLYWDESLYSIVGTYSFYIWVKDTSSNTYQSPSENFLIIPDYFPPDIQDQTLSIAYHNQTFTFRANITDNAKVSTSWVTYWFDAQSSVNVTMNNSMNDLWMKTIVIPSSTSNLSYVISANDTSDQWNDTDIITVPIFENDPSIVDVNQSVFDRGFPIRHAVDGDWAAAQNFTPTVSTITKICLYARVFGTPEFDLTVELREDGPEGTLLDSVSFTPGEVPSSWSWFEIDFSDVTVQPGTDYFIVCPPAPSGVTTSFGYEWGYAFGSQYDDGSFWFTRDGGGLWRDLPTMYEFAFRTFGYS